MKNLFEEHRKVTHAVKEIIKDKKIIFHAYNVKLYMTLASAHNIELNADELHCSKMIKEKVTLHILTLTECTQEAVNAIEHEDKSTLLMILNGTKRLQEEVKELNKIIYEDYLTKSYNSRWLEDTLIGVL